MKPSSCDSVTRHEAAESIGLLGIFDLEELDPVCSKRSLNGAPQKSLHPNRAGSTVVGVSSAESGEIRIGRRGGGGHRPRRPS